MLVITKIRKLNKEQWLKHGATKSTPSKTISNQPVSSIFVTTTTCSTTVTSKTKENNSVTMRGVTQFLKCKMLTSPTTSPILKQRSTQIRNKCPTVGTTQSPLKCSSPKDIWPKCTKTICKSRELIWTCTWKWSNSVVSLIVTIILILVLMQSQLQPVFRMHRKHLIWVQMSTKNSSGRWKAILSITRNRMAIQAVEACLTMLLKTLILRDKLKT